MVLVLLGISIRICIHNVHGLKVVCGVETPPLLIMVWNLSDWGINE